MTAGKDGLWLREQFLTLAGNSGGGMEFWVSQPLISLQGWIRANNAVVETRKKKDMK